MRNSNKRTAAGIMGLLMLVILLFSAFYLAAESDHDCIGEDCPICACIQQCEETLRGATGAAAIQSSVIIPVLVVLLTAVLLTTVLFSQTPVSRKVRLNN